MLIYFPPSIFSFCLPWLHTLQDAPPRPRGMADKRGEDRVVLYKDTVARLGTSKRLRTLRRNGLAQSLNTPNATIALFLTSAYHTYKYIITN
jgi:hypothetical protein